MKKIVCLIILIISFSNSQDTLTTNLGAIYTGKLIEIGDTYVRFFYNDYTSRVPYNIIKKIVLENGTVAFQDKNILLQSDKSDGNNLDSSKIIISSVYQNKSDTPHDLFGLGSVMIVVSGVMGLVNTNRECNDCSMEDWEDFGDSMKLISNIQYSTLIIGGILMAVDHSNKKIVQQE